jgi:uncharacterized membrane protein YedE/YeeE
MLRRSLSRPESPVWRTSGQGRRTRDSYVLIVNLAVAYAVLGIVVGPILFGALTMPTANAPWAAPVWLALALSLALGATILLSRLAEPLAVALVPGLVKLGAHMGPSITPSEALLLERLVIAGIQVLLAQAVVRRPLALVVAGDRSASSFEAGIAAAALAVVLAGLVWAYQTARPAVYAAVLRVLDSAIPTVGTTPPTVTSPHEAAITVPSGRQGVTTVRAAPQGEATVPRSHDGDTTIVTPGSAQDLPTLPGAHSKP